MLARPLSSVVLPAAAKASVTNDVTEFLSEDTWDFYRAHGIPYKRSYLFYGVPGSGKTSLIQAIAGTHGLNICYLSPTDPEMTDDGFKKAVTTAPDRSMLILEDVDALFDANRENKIKKSSLTFSGLLNALDGVGQPSQQIFVLTTNHRERLDPALIRNGRVDLHIEFKHATRDQMAAMFDSYYPVESCAGDGGVGGVGVGGGDDTDDDHAVGDTGGMGKDSGDEGKDSGEGKAGSSTKLVDDAAETKSDSGSTTSSTTSGFEIVPADSSTQDDGGGGPPLRLGAKFADRLVALLKKAGMAVTTAALQHFFISQRKSTAKEALENIQGIVDDYNEKQGGAGEIKGKGKGRKFKKGERVEAKCGDWLKHYPGHVTRVHGDGTYAIDFDDGETKTNVRSDSMVSLRSKSGGESTRRRRRGAKAHGRGRTSGGGGGGGGTVVHVHVGSGGDGEQTDSGRSSAQEESDEDEEEE